MASINKLTGSACLIGTHSVSSAAATVTVVPGGVRAAVAVFGILITSSAVPSGAAVGTLSDGVTTLVINLPATIFPAGFVYNFPSGHPWVAANGATVTLVVGSLGVLCNASLMYGLVEAQ